MKDSKGNGFQLKPGEKENENKLPDPLNEDIQKGQFSDTDIMKLEEGIGEKLSTFFFYQASFLSSVIMALVKGWKLALLCLISFPVTMTLVGVAGLIAANLSKKEAVATGKAGAIAEEVISAIRTVYAFSGQEKELERYEGHLNDARKINVKKSLFNGLAMGCLFFCIFCAYALSFWFGYRLMVTDDYEVSTMIAVLKGVSINVKRGQSVALVGHSGCGKSTIIQLISRFYDVVEGSVSIDGNDVRDLSVRWLRDQIGLVGQEPVLFNTTVRENIRYGRENATNEEIEACARQANAHQFIMKLPKGYDTLVGERGASLSGGQKQRIAIARALVRNPRILLLDEATSALDTSSEAKVQKALDKAQQGRTTIVVAHRLSTIRNVDVIYVFKAGLVVECGNHMELMARKGHYYDMVMLQNLPGMDEQTPEKTKLSRETSIISEKDDEDEFLEFRTDDKDEDAVEAPDISFWRVLKLNKPEWKSVTLASICSLMSGFCMPLFAVIFGDFLAATGQRIGTVVQAVGTFGFALVLSLIFEWRVGLVALTFVPIIIFVLYKEGRMTYAATSGTVRAMESSSKIAVEAVANVRTVASLGREDTFRREYGKQLRPALDTAVRSSHWRGLVFGMSRGVFNFVIATSLYYGGTLIVNEGVPFQEVFKSAQALLMGATSAAQAFAFAPNFQKGIKAAGRVIVLLGRPSKITDPAEPAVKQFISDQASRARAEGSESGDPAREDRGAGGCQWLREEYRHTTAREAQDGVPLPKLRLVDARRAIGFVQQEPILFDRTIGENIAYGNNEAHVTHDEVIEAAKQANIHNFITSLPLGYDTNIGSKGTQLSGGQKQRVAIARALIRRPKMLLLDEATSALDTESEKVVQEALDAAKAGRTCVMIAHRLSTVRDADVICVIHEGQVAEMGTHNELLELKGLYYNLNRRGYA
ncbi:hypothetical protein HF086_001294 [Spodoptera exigua]|uniref:ABC-type xenobiotic transporter n=1 Tax=Spodoptera exigua TaxID=7107 RepID=A0A922MBY5_SPOEX|nr:hypothetical protein HF086_001294 [Spodoptera exigua]